jgi:recombinational DNA repair protein (RecF pathway)
MAYHVYHTEALIIGGHGSGEGDRLLFCYTRELGLVFAHAKSLREHRSRLRYALQTFAHAQIDLIHGKSGWKLISARPIDSFSDVWCHPAKRRLLAQHTSLMRRLIQGEERHALLFDEILAGLEFLRGLDPRAKLTSLELLLVVRLLAHLGYWGEDHLSASLVSETGYSNELLLRAEALRPLLLEEVNTALSASQL